MAVRVFGATSPQRVSEREVEESAFPTVAFLLVFRNADTFRHSVALLEEQPFSTRANGAGTRGSSGRRGGERRRREQKKKREIRTARRGGVWVQWAVFLERHLPLQQASSSRCVGEGCEVLTCFALVLLN